MPNTVPEQTETTGITGIFPEPCPAPTAFQIDRCRDAVRVTLPDTELLSLGRIVQVDVTLKSICPGKQVAASILLMEELPDGTKAARGSRHILVPPQTGTGCRDITLRCIPFSLPEALDPDGPTLCNARKFSAQVFANYVDTDFVCCDETAVTV